MNTTGGQRDPVEQLAEESPSDCAAVNGPA